MHMIYNPLSTAVDCGALTNPANGNVSITLLEQHLERQPTTVVIQDTTW